MTKEVKNMPMNLLDVLKWAPEYWERKQALLYHRNKCAESYLITGKLLCDAEARRDYRHDGSDALNFFQWAEHEIGYKRTNVQRIMKNWVAVKQFLPDNLDLVVSIDFSKLSMVAPLLEFEKDDDKKLEWLHMAKENTVKDLELNIKEACGKKDSTFECPHDIQKTVIVCKKCGKVLSIDEK